MLLAAVLGLAGSVGFGIDGGWTGPGAALAAADRVAVVSRLAGQVERQGPDGGGALKVGDPVHSQDRVITGADGRARLRFEDGSTIVVGPGSDLAVASYDFDDTAKPGGLLRLAQGILRAVVDTMPGNASFSVASPTAVAAVRGTAFIVEACPATTGIFVIEGAVAVDSIQPAGEAVTVRGDQGTDVKQGAAPTPPARWGQDRVRRVLSATQFD